MKFAKTFSVLTLIETFAIYLLISFVFFDPNPCSWGADTRGEVATLWVLLALPSAAFLAIVLDDRRV